MRREIVTLSPRRDISRGWKGVDEERENKGKAARWQTS